MKKDVENSRLALELRHAIETLEDSRKAWDLQRVQLEKNAEDTFNEYAEYKAKIQMTLIARDSREEKLIKELRQHKIKVKIYEERIEEFNRQIES